MMDDFPCFGLGLSHNGGWDRSTVEKAIELGVRLFDTAKRYDNETELGQVLRDAMHGKLLFQQNGGNGGMKGKGIPREEFFVSTKFWPGDLGHSGVNIDMDIEQALQQSLKRLQLDYVDLYLLHWPGSFVRSAATPPALLRQAMWRAMEKVRSQGLARRVGVSNFEVRHLQDVLEICTPQKQKQSQEGEDTAKKQQQQQAPPVLPPFVNQFELNPLLPNVELRRYCEAVGVRVEGYCPFAKGAVFRHKTIQQAAAQVPCGVETLVILWSIVRCGAIMIPKTCSHAHLQTNVESAQIGLKLLLRNDDNFFGDDGEAGKGRRKSKLSQAFAVLDGLGSGYRSTWDPSGVP